MDKFKQNILAPRGINAIELADAASRWQEEHLLSAANIETRAVREQQLGTERSKRVEAERMGEVKDEFLANLSQEIRTPLTAILGWAQLLKPGETSLADMTKGLEVIRRNARAQATLIEDLLDMSRIISGKMRLDVQRVDLATAIGAAVDVVQLAADAKGVRIEVVVDPLAGPVSGDPARVQQMIWNLVSNAVKFTPRGGKVQITVERVSSHIEMSVSDTGDGIAPEFLPHVFDRFTQADKRFSHRSKGLGLAIVKNLAELHGGTVNVKSGGLGRGSTFIISLPISVVRSLAAGDMGHHPTSGTVADVLESPDLAGIEVLVIDDDEDALDMVRNLLGRCNATVTTCGAGSDCLRLLPTIRLDVLISDIGMLPMDGYELIKAVRALPVEHGGNTPAIALTAHARSEDRRHAMLSGFDLHVARPVEPSELEAVVARLARRA